LSLFSKTFNKGEDKMRTALDLLKEVINLGFDQQKTLIRIDKILDKKLGIESRKPLLDEKLPDDIYMNILNIFIDKLWEHIDVLKI